VTNGFTKALSIRLLENFKHNLDLEKVKVCLVQLIKLPHKLNQRSTESSPSIKKHIFQTQILKHSYFCAFLSS
jgi:hypothetical protein